MSNLNNNEHEDIGMKRGLAVSFALHAFLLSLFTLKAVFFTPKPIDFSQAIRVDMVGLPDKEMPKDLTEPATKTPAAKPTPVEEKKVETPPKETPKKETKVAEKKNPLPEKKDNESVNLEKVKAKQQSAIDKLKAMAALEKIKEEVQNTKPEATAQNTSGTQAGTKPVRGNVVTPGNSLTGLAKLEHDNYASTLDKHIKEHWYLPEFLAKRNYTAQALVRIDKYGNVLEKKIIKSSANPDYDDSVLDTIQKSEPFPTPPERLSEVVAVTGIIIGFPE